MSNIFPPTAGSDELTSGEEALVQGLAAISTTRGNLIAGNTAGWVGVSAGVDGQILSADAASSGGIKWIAATGTGDMLLDGVQTVTAAKTFNDGKLILGGAGAGVGTFSYANSAANATLTFPATTGTVALTSDITGDVSKVGTPANNQVGVWTGDGTIEGDALLIFNSGQLNIGTSGADIVSLNGNDGSISMQSDSVGTEGAALLLYQNSASPAAGDAVGLITFQGQDSATLSQSYASIKGIITDATNASEDGKLTFGVAVAGTLADRAELSGTSLYPTTNDGLSLGTASLQFSDLFLASGAVINFASGNATLTHSSGLLTSNVPLSLGTSNALTAGTIELGAASDTTIARVSAGVVSIEGKNILTTDGGTLTGSITLGENTSIALDPAGSADGKYTGITVSGTAGAALAFGDLIYLDPTDSRWELADANAAAAADGDARGILGICVLAAAGDASATNVLLHGIVRADTAFPALTIGAPVYVSETAGDIVVTQPTTTDVVIRIVGVAITADEIFFNPDNTWVTHI